MLDENAAGQAGRKDIAGRLSEHCLVKIHVFDQSDAEPRMAKRGKNDCRSKRR
jgi:hypothetical protein